MYIRGWPGGGSRQTTTTRAWAKLVCSLAIEIISIPSQLDVGFYLQKKRISEKYTEIFLEFLVFPVISKLKIEKQKWEKLFTRESSQQAKEEARNLFGFSFNNTTNWTRNKNRREARNIFGFSQKNSNTIRKRENKTNMDNTMKNCVHRQLEWSVWTWM